MARSLSSGDVITAGAFSPEALKPVVTPSGHSGIFHFPFRIHAQEPLCPHDGVGSEFRYRIHAPFLVRPTGSPLTEDVPQELWPDFRWHDLAPEEMRKVSAAPDLHYAKGGQNAILYDGLRVDLWATDAANRLSALVLSAMRWLRNFSGQPWISDVDRHNASTMKRSFPIDDSGAAVHEAIGVTRVRLTTFTFVTDAMWKSAFEHAARFDIPISGSLYFDAINAAAIDDYDRAIMNLAMALESCRDYCFAKIHPSENVEGRGPRLKTPFNSTNLLKHLSVHSETTFGRNFKKEQPSLWPHLKRLYVARHHVAHGKGPVFPTPSGIKTVDKDSFSEMQASALVALRWMADLSRIILNSIDSSQTK